MSTINYHIVKFKVIFLSSLYSLFFFRSPDVNIPHQTPKKYFLLIVSLLSYLSNAVRTPVPSFQTLVITDASKLTKDAGKQILFILALCYPLFLPSSLSLSLSLSRFQFVKRQYKLHVNVITLLTCLEFKLQSYIIYNMYIITVRIISLCAKPGLGRRKIYFSIKLVGPLAF